MAIIPVNVKPLKITLIYHLSFLSGLGDGNTHYYSVPQHTPVQQVFFDNKKFTFLAMGPD